MIAAIVPAAGESRRMGRPKLILPIEGRPLIARVVSAFREGGAFGVVVVSPPANAPGSLFLRQEAEAAGARVVVPETQPVDMRASIERAIAELEQDPAVPRAVLLAPADSPGLTPSLVKRLIEAHRRTPRLIVVPSVNGRRGHPIALPWLDALAIRALPPDRGVNALIAQRGALVVDLEVDDEGALDDLDTPEQYARWEKHPAMTIKVRLFALARDCAGAPEVAIDLPAPATVGALKTALAQAHPALAPLMPSLMFAVDDSYASESTVIPPGAEVAAFPPVSGGGDAASLSPDSTMRTVLRPEMN